MRFYVLSAVLCSFYVVFTVEEDTSMLDYSKDCRGLELLDISNFECTLQCGMDPCKGMKCPEQYNCLRYCLSTECTCRCVIDLSPIIQILAGSHNKTETKRHYLQELPASIKDQRPIIYAQPQIPDISLKEQTPIISLTEKKLANSVTG